MGYLERMRTYEEIKAEITKASDATDADALLRLADELGTLNTPNATAESHRSRGTVDFFRGSYSTALDHYQKALDLHEELGNHNGMAVVSRNIGIVYGDTGNYPAALEHYQRALDLHEELGNRRGVALVTGNIGSIYGRTGNNPSALEYYQRALDLHEELGNRRGVALNTGNIGNVYINTGDYPAALECYQRAMDMDEELGNRRGVAANSGNIGNVYADTGDYPAALENYQRALDIHEELGDRMGVAQGTGNIGTVYYSTGDYSAALELIQRALAMDEELGNRHGLARDTGNVGRVYFDTGDCPAALEYFQRALDMHEELGDRRGAALVTANIVACLWEMNRMDEAVALMDQMDIMTIEDPSLRVLHINNRARTLEMGEDLEGAQEKYLEALEVAKNSALRASQVTVHENLRDLAQKRNDFAAYIEHNNEFLRITEEINGKEAATKIAMQEKQREIDAERKEHEKQIAVLHSTLPKHIADRVARGETVNDHYDNAAVMFLDIVGFTTISQSLPASEVVTLLESVFGVCDEVCGKHSVTKIKTIGDSYMAVAFPAEGLDNCEERIAQAAVGIIDSVTQVKIRIGLHSGPVVAGVLGKERMQYDVWGDTVNVASRMESSGEAGKIQVSEVFVRSSVQSDNVRSSVQSDNVRSSAQGAKDDSHSGISFVERGEIDIKGKGQMKTYWLEKS